MGNTSDLQSTLRPSPELETAVTKLWGVVRQAGEIIVSLREDNRHLVLRLAEVEEGNGQEQSQSAADDSEVRRRLAELEQEAMQSARLRDELREREESIADLKQQLAGAEDLLTAAQEETAVLRRESEVRQRDVQDSAFLKAELVSRNAELNARQNEILELQNQLAEVEDKLLRGPEEAEDHEGEDPILKAPDESELLRKEVYKYKTLYEEQKELYEKRIKNREPYQVDLFTASEIDTEWRNKTGELDAELHRLVEMKAALEQNLQQRRKELQAAQNEAQELQARIADLEENLAGLETEKREREAECLQLRRQVDQLATGLQAESGDAGAARRLQTELARAADLQTQIESVQAERSRLAERVRQLEAIIEAQSDDDKGRVDLNPEERERLQNRVSSLLTKVEGLIGET